MGCPRDGRLLVQVEPWLSELSELSEKLSELSGTVGHCRTVGLSDLSDCRITVGQLSVWHYDWPLSGTVGTVGLSDHCRTLSDVLFGWSWVGRIAVASMKVAILSVVLVITVDPLTIRIQSHPKINQNVCFGSHEQGCKAARRHLVVTEAPHSSSYTERTS